MRVSSNNTAEGDMMEDAIDGGEKDIVACGGLGKNRLHSLN